MSNGLTQNFTSFWKRQEVGVFEHKARALLTPPRDAREQPVKIDEIRPQLSLKLATDGAPVTGRVLLGSGSTQARSLERRSLAMYSSLRLPDRSRLRLLDPPRRLAAASGGTEASNVRVEGALRLAPRDARTARNSSPARSAELT
jgi:hypothetical protein